jgi:hypothetical protein
MCEAHDGNHHPQLLTNLERIRAAERALQSADGATSTLATGLSRKMRAVLRARPVSNGKRQYDNGCVRPYAAESRLVSSLGTFSHTYFSH